MKKDVSALVLFLVSMNLFLWGVPSHAVGPESSRVEEDLVLRNQIDKVSGALQEVNQEMARARKANQKAPPDVPRAALLKELDRLRKERDDLESLLHQLVETGQATGDETIKRVRRFERSQERLNKSQESLRERRDREQAQPQPQQSQQ